MRQQVQKGTLKKVQGRWVARWREEGRGRSRVIGYYPEMKRAEAEGILSKLIQPINARRLDLPVRKTFAQFVRDPYLPFYGRKWKRTTLAANSNRIAVHLLPAFGDRPIADLGWNEMQKFLDEKAGELSYSVVAHLRWDLQQILHMAVIEQEIDRNPAELLFIPREARRPEHRVMTRQEVVSCLSALEERERLMVGLAVLAGMRPGEVLALRCGRVGETSVDIRERVYKGDLDTPKTANSVRQAVLPSELMSALHAWIQRLPLNGPDDWVFPSERLTMPAALTNIWRRHILPKLDKIGLAWATFQVMRRTYSTLSYDAGGDAKLVADQMGHSVDVNQNVYTKSHLSRRRELAEQVAEQLGLGRVLGRNCVLTSRRRRKGGL